MITSLGIEGKSRPKKYKRERYAIRNFCKKELLKIIRGFEKLPSKSYESRKPKHEPTDSYFYLARQLSKCMMIADALNLNVYPVTT